MLVSTLYLGPTHRSGEFLKILDEVSRTLNEYLLLPNLTTADCTAANVDLSAPLVRHRLGESAF